jgi:acetolactate synthase-1/2/3 large subunit
MDFTFSRRGMLQGLAVAGGLLAGSTSDTLAGPLRNRLRRNPGWVQGHMTGALAAVETLIQEGCDCVYGIPGAQENELWDAFKTKNLPYLLATHEFSAACMADGYARSTGKPGVIAVVPGPGLTNSLTGLGEALLDSVPLVCLVGDVAQGEKYRPFQVHCLDQVALLKPVTKGVFNVTKVSEIPEMIRRAFALAIQGEPGPVGVVIPYTLFIEAAHFQSAPLEPCGVPFDATAVQTAISLLRNPKVRIGIYAGQGCLDFSESLTQVAELLQAPVATSVSGKGAINDCHPLAVGWGYGAHASIVAEKIFKGKPLLPNHAGVDLVLAIGVKYSEVSTGFYGNPKKRVIHVDANKENLGRAVQAEHCVHSDAGVFLAKLLEQGDQLRRPIDGHLQARIRELKIDEQKRYSIPESKHGVDPALLLSAMRRSIPEDGSIFVDVSVTEHLAAEMYKVYQPRTYFNPTDNQAMGWSIPAAIGTQRVQHGKVITTLTGDGCLLMTSNEISTAAREHLPVKFFVLDDQAYHYMQMLQQPAYLRTTATILAKIDYEALARAYGVAYLEIASNADLEANVRRALCHAGPVLVRVLVDYRDRKFRWIEAVRDRYVGELSFAQKTRFLARVGSRAIDFRRVND